MLLCDIFCRELYDTWYVYFYYYYYFTYFIMFYWSSMKVRNQQNKSNKIQLGSCVTWLSPVEYQTFFCKEFSSCFILKRQ
jgi:hypothetical protein